MLHGTLRVFAFLQHRSCGGTEASEDTCYPAHCTTLSTLQAELLYDSPMLRSSMTTMMKAVVVREFGGVKKMKVETDMSVPSVGDHEVLIKMYASGINPVDTYIREGMYTILPELPYVPGKDGAGVVAALGTKVTKFKLGDRVFCSLNSRYGTLAGLTSVPETRVYPLEGNLSFEEGASIGIPYFTACRALVQKAKAKKGERLLVHGASGGVGLAAVQLGRELGLHVVGTAGTDEGISLVKEMGVHDVLNHREPKYLNKLGAEKFDIILEMLANVNLDNDLTLMKSRGRTIVVGSRGPTQINPRNLMLSESSVTGVALGTATAEELAELAAVVVDGIKAGWVMPKVYKVYSFDEASQAHLDIIHSKGAQGNLVVRVTE